MKLLRTHIAGIPHRKPASLPNVGDIVTLVPEPQNPYDANAIKVLHGDVHLGYIPKTETATVRQFNWTTMQVAEVVPERKWSEVIIENIDEPISVNP